MSDAQRPQLVYRPPFGDTETIDLAHDRSDAAIRDLDRLDLVVLIALLERALGVAHYAEEQRIGL